MSFAYYAFASPFLRSMDLSRRLQGEVPKPLTGPGKLFMVIATAFEAALAIMMLVSICLSLLLLQSESAKHCVSETKDLDTEGCWLFWLAIIQGILASLILLGKRKINEKDAELVQYRERELEKHNLLIEAMNRRKRIYQQSGETAGNFYLNPSKKASIKKHHMGTPTWQRSLAPRPSPLGSIKSLQEALKKQSGSNSHNLRSESVVALEFPKSLTSSLHTADYDTDSDLENDQDEHSGLISRGRRREEKGSSSRKDKRKEISSRDDSGKNQL